MCPKEYDRLIVEVAGAQNWDTDPTACASWIYHQTGDEEPILFLTNTIAYTDICATDAVFRALKRSTLLFKNNKIAVPKEIILRIHNVHAFCILTRQINRMYKYQFRAIELIAWFKKHTGKIPIRIELTNLNRIFDRDDPNYPWRRNKHKNSVPSEIATGVKFKEIYSEQMILRKKVIQNVLQKS